MAQLGGQPQLDLQMAIVKALKDNGANTVGIRFEELPAETVEQYTGKKKEQPKTIEGLYLKTICRIYSDCFRKRRVVNLQ